VSYNAASSRFERYYGDDQLLDKYNLMVSVIVIAHHNLAEGRHLLKGLIARSADAELRQQVLQLIDSQAGELV